MDGRVLSQEEIDALLASMAGGQGNSARDSKAAPTEPSGGANSPKTVLLVDDSSFMREMIEALLDLLGFAVIGEAENGKIGVEKYKELKPDVVFMDIMMDEMNGFEALTQILRFDPNAHVIMLSSMMKQDSFVSDVTSLGAKATLTKPPLFESVKKALAALS